VVVGHGEARQKLSRLVNQRLDMGDARQKILHITQHDHVSMRLRRWTVLVSAVAASRRQRVTATHSTTTDLRQRRKRRQLTAIVTCVS
jgi:septal ring factor EnvC (AmiA/AmiB activator)